jgi:hypothetical protein
VATLISLCGIDHHRLPRHHRHAELRAAATRKKERKKERSNICCCSEEVVKTVKAAIAACRVVLVVKEEEEEEEGENRIYFNGLLLFGGLYRSVAAIAPAAMTAKCEYMPGQAKVSQQEIVLRKV